MRYLNQPKLTLIGAGPGDPDLITVKGLKRLAEAAVVLYDALVNTSLLRYVPSKAKKVFVGKREGYHVKTQDEINTMIVELAREYGNVVRLKGGDPFIFGRGFEELAHAVKNSIPTEIVPGISSSTGLSALAGIPLTLRGHGEGFWVITGTTSDKQLSSDLILASKSTATVVILMGMRKISQITRIYKNNAQGNMPVMLIQNGSMQNEKRVTGTINNIEQEIRTSGLSSPAVIIIGKILQEALPIVSSNRIITENLKHEEQKVNGEFSYAKQYENDTEQFISRFY